MKKQLLLMSISLVVVLFAVGIVAAQNDKKMTKGEMDMMAMEKSPHHKLMTAHTKTMADFSRMLRDQAVTPNGPDVEFVRAAVAELRHNLDAMETVHQKHMAGMSAEMKEKMKMMMEKMDKERSLINDQVGALETDVQANTPDSKQVAMHTTALLKHLDMMSKMQGGGKPGKKMAKKMTMKKKMNMEIKPI